MTLVCTDSCVLVCVRAASTWKHTGKETNAFEQSAQRILKETLHFGGALRSCFVPRHSEFSLLCLFCWLQDHSLLGFCLVLCKDTHMYQVLS